MLHKLLRKKSIEENQHDSLLERSLSASDLTLMGIGAVIGAGVFILTGVAAATKAGPAIVISYMIAGLAAMFTALAYSELAASIGGSGSAYNYAYIGFGELVAWMIGWDLLFEYAMSISTVAIGWSGYVNNLLEVLNIQLPEQFTKSPFEGGAVNLLAIFIIAMISILMCIGVKYSARFNAAIVFVKLITIAVFIAVAIPNIDRQNWHNFLPFGWSGVMQGAALVFFAYIGFDALSTTVEETINPQRNVPIGIMTSLTICTIIYIIVAALLTCIVPYTMLNVRSPVADALLRLGYHTVAGLVAAGAIAGLTTVILVIFYGLTRIFLAIARDGFLPRAIMTINPRTRTPIRIIIFTGIITAFIAGFLPIHLAAELVNIGTLTAFALVCLGTLALRWTRPDLPRPFKLPFSPFIPLLGAGFCIYLITQLSTTTWWRFAIWATIGLFVYFLYGQRRSMIS